MTFRIVCHNPLNGKFGLPAEGLPDLETAEREFGRYMSDGIIGALSTTHGGQTWIEQEPTPPHSLLDIDPVTDPIRILCPECEALASRVCHNANGEYSTSQFHKARENAWMMMRLREERYAKHGEYGPWNPSGNPLSKSTS